MHVFHFGVCVWVRGCGCGRLADSAPAGGALADDERGLAGGSVTSLEDPPGIWGCSKESAVPYPLRRVQVLQMLHHVLKPTHGVHTQWHL